MMKRQVFLSQACDSLKQGHFVETAVAWMQAAYLSDHTAVVYPVMMAQHDQAELALKVTVELVEKIEVADLDQQALQHWRETPVPQAETAEMPVEQMAVLAVLELAETAAKEISHDTVTQNSYKRTDDKTH